MKLIKYSFVSLISLILDLLLVYLLTDFFDVDYLVSVTIGFFFSVAVAFFINRSFVFHSNVSFSFGYSKSMIVALITFCSIFLTTFFLTEKIGFYYLYSRVVASIVAGLISFILDSTITFKK